MLAFNKRNNEPRAIKSINKSTITPDEKAQFRYFAEMDILRSLQHPNIIKVYEVFEDNRCYHMVTEFWAGGELFSYIVKR
jgi:calcium-dependent protein kinase